MKIFSFLRRDGDSIEEGTIAEETVVVSDDGSGGAALDEVSVPFINIARWALYALLFLFPIWFLPLTELPVEMNKMFLTIILSLFALIAWIGAGLQNGRIPIAKSPVIWAYGAFLLGWLAASLLSENISVSLYGSGADPTSFVAFLIGGVLLVLIPSLLNRREDIIKAFSGIFIAALIVFVLFLLRSVLNVPLSGSRAFNPIGSWNGLGVFFGFIIALSIPLLGLPRNLLVWKASLILFVLSIISAILINFFWVWVGIGVLSLIFFSLYFSAGKRKSLLFTVSFLLIIASLLLILLRGPLGDLSARIGSLTEVGPSFSTTLSVSKETIKESAFFGQGPNTFGLAWEKHRPEGVSITPFWRIRFSSGSGLVPTLITEGGIVGVGLFLIFLFVFLSSSIKAIVRAIYVEDESWEAALILSLFSGSVFLLFMWFIYGMNITLVLLTLISVGLFMAAAQSVGVGSVSSVNLFANAQKGFVASLIMIVVVISGVFGLYIGGTRYVSQIMYQNGVNSFNEDGSIEKAKQSILGSTKFYEERDVYWRSLAQLELVNIQTILNTTDVSEPEGLAKLQAAIDSAIQFGLKATEVGPVDSENWRILAEIYQAVSFLDGAADFSKGHFEKARSLSPKDPLIVVGIGRAHLSKADLFARSEDEEIKDKATQERQNAINAFEEALKIKADYAPAHFQLARLYTIEGKTEQAIARAEAAFQLAPRDVGAAFQLGVLYYGQQDFDNAKIAFKRAVDLNSNYSNARYFLGLIYANDGETDKAIEQFEAISALNPDNQEVANILANLKTDTEPLEGIVPPAESPEEREDLPISETEETDLLEIETQE